MAYLSSETFDIMRGDEINPPPKGWFYADDRLAETIQALNLRGYATCGCRIDPAFDPYTQATLFNVRDSEGKTPAAAEIARAYEEKYPDARVTAVAQIGYRRYRLTIRVRAPKMIRIRFSRNVRFQGLPDGFIYADNALACLFSDDAEGMGYLSQCQTRVQDLYDWVCALPVGLW